MVKIPEIEVLQNHGLRISDSDTYTTIPITIESLGEFCGVEVELTTPSGTYIPFEKLYPLYDPNKEMLSPYCFTVMDVGYTFGLVILTSNISSQSSIKVNYILGKVDTNPNTTTFYKEVVMARNPIPIVKKTNQTVTTMKVNTETLSPYASLEANIVYRNSDGDLVNLMDLIKNGRGLSSVQSEYSSYFSLVVSGRNCTGGAYENCTDTFLQNKPYQFINDESNGSNQVSFTINITKTNPLNEVSILDEINIKLPTSVSVISIS
ncbi:MAG: hypothetical protein PHF63_00080 [Herbinix sp.]|nr:hypothetical protein [Herbinix sp.]